MEALSTAISKSQRVVVEYAGVRRVLEPWSLLYQDSVWYLDALQVGEKEPKRFRLNHLQSLEVLGQGSEHSRGPASSACFHPWDLGTGPAHDVVARITPQLASWLAENPAHPSQVLDHETARYVVRNRDSFCGWLLSLTGAVLEQAPADWLAALRTRLRELVAHYDAE